MSDDPVLVQRLSALDSEKLFREIAGLHAEQIRGGVLPLLGQRFLAILYREIASSKWGTVHQAMLDGRAVGFIAGTANIWRCAFGFTVRGYLRLASILGLRIWHPDIARKFLDALAYPFREPSTPAAENLPRQGKHRAELLAIAVASEAQGRGVGRALVGAFEETLRGNVTSYSVTTNAEDTQSNAFYDAVGFKKSGQKRHHDLLIQIYVKAVDGD
jgi:ribosomal protein S18 acetylase RimI-like enzyme